MLATLLNSKELVTDIIRATCKNLKVEIDS